ncbi:MAG: SDR family NAD(P)-dependent oxidoreductase [Christensenellales bacterium]|jgi:3-oxoacyl-[acyl-carrier protein] reductase
MKVLVTGASVGIGRATAVAFAGRGHSVVINYRKAEKDAEETLRLVEAAGGTGYLLQADVSDEADAARAVNEAAELLGGLDVLVNNAGVTRFIPFSQLDDATEEVWTSLYKTNVESIFFCSRAASKIMKAQPQGGAIVNLASVAGMLPNGSSIPYAVTKAAIIHLTKCLARELAPEIRVNCVSPGVIQNTRWNSTNPNFDPEAFRANTQTIPLGKLGNPEDIAEAIYYLCSDAAGFITGINLPVEGGANVRV